MKTASAIQAAPPSLDPLYALIGADLKRVDQLILKRIEHDVPMIADIARHIIASGGKRIRPALTLVSAQLCQSASERACALAAAIEFLHTATLLHDDVVDESELRRGLASANNLFGNKGSILVGDFLLSQAFQLMVEQGSSQTMKILADASAVISRGEVMQLAAEGKPETSLADYLAIIEAKTAALFAAACEIGASLSDKEPYGEALKHFGLNIGMAFQLMDDVLDYSADEEQLGKTVGDDFREGKITFPVLFAYQAANEEERRFWRQTLAEKNQRPGDLENAQKLLAKHGALNQGIALAHSYCDQARGLLADFALGAAKSAMLDIVDFCAARSF